MRCKRIPFAASPTALAASAATIFFAAGLLVANTAPKTSQEYAFEVYREKGEGLTVLLDAYPASLHASDPDIPIPIAIGFDGPAGPVRLDDESFELIGPDGSASPVAGFTDVLRGYPKRTFDQSLLRARPMAIGSQFSTSRRVASRFFPAPGRGTRIATVELAPFTWFHDVLYFPMPAGGLGGTLTLRVKAAGLPKPLDVRFRIPEQPARFGE